jgi:hypothetical protein
VRRVAPLVAAVFVAAAVLPFLARAEEPPQRAVPRAQCGPGDRPEPGLQGRPASPDGHTCNTEVIGHFGSAGAYRVHRYVDAAGHECAFYDSSLVFPIGVMKQGADGTGVYVLDMTDPTKPVKTANLVTPAMLSPHESLSLNKKRGLLAAVMGNPITLPGFVDIYDVSQDCRHPVLKSSSPVGIFGHEGEFSPDGNTYWVSSSGATGTVVAVDISDPVVPKPLWMGFYRGHGLNVSDDGNRVYLTTLGTGAPPDGVVILDSTQIQQRVPDPQVPEISTVTWNDVSIPQTAIPVTIKGHRYLVQVDEFATKNGPVPSGEPDAHVGAARIIDIEDETKPSVVSTMKLEVNLTEHRAETLDDPGNENPLGGYTAHYCAVPKREDPGIVACSFVLSGLRVFDIRDPLHPRELAYFVAPAAVGGATASASNYTLSAPTFVPERGEVWYADGNSGFYAVRLTNGVWPFPAPAAAAPAPAAQVLGGQASRPAPAPAGAGRLPSTGGSTAAPLLGLGLLLAAVVARRVSRATAAR